MSLHSLAADEQELQEAPMSDEAALLAGTEEVRASWWTRRQNVVLGGVCALLASSGVVACFRRPVDGSVLQSADLGNTFKLYEGDLKMPGQAEQYGGVDDKRVVSIGASKAGETSVFVLGDWGATLPDHKTFAGKGKDDWEQYAVANAMKKRAQWAQPAYILNVGDNFYVAGIEGNCNAPPWDNQGRTEWSFQQAWQGIYGELTGKPWLSVLGNHDYGGWRYDKGWAQQIGYSFINHNWIMPARYFKKTMHHPDFDVDYFMYDSNAMDAMTIGSPGEDEDHNMCSKHNYKTGTPSCAANGGMESIEECKDWFWRTYNEQKVWLEKAVAESKARWKVVVTHFPCGFDTEYFRNLKAKYGLDLLLTGHRHQQEIWRPDSASKYVQSFMQFSDWHGDLPACLVSGGGGGIVSQKFDYADYGDDLAWYGFFHLTITKDSMRMALIGTDGVEHGDWTIYPHGTPGFEKQKKVKATGEGLCEWYCGNQQPWAKVCKWGTDPWMSCSSCSGCR